MNLNDFNRQIQSVIDWNAVASGMTHSFTQEKIEAQTGYVHEEIMETIAGLATKDTIETLDGVGDIFVTLAYKYFLIREEFDLDFDPDDIFEDEELVDQRLRQNSLIYVAGLISSHNLFGSETVDEVEQGMSILYAFMEKVEEWYGVDVHALVDEVMASNWSKFPIFSEHVDYDSECRGIEATHKRMNVSYRISNVGGVDRVSFRDNFGAGKIGKPSTFVEPNVARLL